jgi:Tol biopolymer transport system component
MSPTHKLPLLLGTLLTLVSCADATAPRRDIAVYDLVFESFESPTSNQNQLYWIRAGDTTPAPLFGGTDFQGQPNVSADGRWVTYTAPQEATGDFSIRMPRIDGTDRRELYASTTHTLSLPTFSPDGRRIAFVKHAANGSSDIWIVDIDGTGAHALTSSSPEAPLIHSYPAWSPDGTRIALSWGGAGQLRLATVLVTGGALTPVTQSAASDVEPSWSPNGQFLVFARTASPAQSDLRIVEVATRQVTPLFIGENSRRPAWSPNGDLVAFSGRMNGGQADIYLVGVNNGALTRVTTNEVTDRHPTWARRAP